MCGKNMDLVGKYMGIIFPGKQYVYRKCNPFVALIT